MLSLATSTLNRFFKVTVGTWPSTSSPGKSSKDPDLQYNIMINILVLSMKDILSLGSLSCTHVPKAFKILTHATKCSCIRRGEMVFYKPVGHSKQKTPTTHPSVCPRHRTFHERETLGQSAKGKFQLRSCDTCVNCIQVLLDGWIT